ncbi:SCAN domain-containing protein 3-like [Palaemon carinicauda]|uniref:SCAN domain-containing protein 3-like n=1 Tax=Palaemon carinicauda TaxID=392227 RepID=UPI0035B6128E
MIKYEENEKQREENEKQREENEKQRAHELELQKIRGATSNPSHVTVAVDTTRPLPFCDTDDITAYLVRFEKVAVSLNWERNSWSVQLASLLRGKALDIYTSLSDDVTSDYASLKEALLKGFKKTSDWYRTAFKTAKMDSKSTYEQYLNMLFRNFDLWINSLSVTKDYEDLRNIIVCDQFMSTLPKEMRLFLKERKPRTPEDYSSLADTYASAHKCYPKDEQKYFRHNANLSSSSDKISASEKPEKTNLSRPGKIACYGCGQSGHISRNCPNKVPKKKSESSLEIGQVLDNTGVCGPMVCGTVNGVTVSTILRDTEPFDISIDHESFLREQQNCEALKYAREMSQSGDVKRCKNGLQYEFVMRNGLLYRKIQKCKKPQLLGKEQLVVPVKCIKLVLRLAHDIPGMTSDIYKYCKSCDVCQKSSLVGKVKKAQMVKLPVISTPFYRVAIDLVGPISPPSEAGHRYILTMVDYASSFPEAVALKNITSEDIAEALISIFSRVGVPKEILSDRGPQFRSELMLQVHKLLGVKPLFSTPYHPAANGRIERQHQILKSILKKICELKHNQWHRFLPAALFAMREIPSDTTGFSPFEILYGRQIFALEGYHTKMISPHFICRILQGFPNLHHSWNTNFHLAGFSTCRYS